MNNSNSKRVKRSTVSTGIPTENQEVINSINEYGRKAKGKAPLLKYLNGNVLNERDTILAKCYDCMNFYADGLISCGITTCPLFLFSPYNRVICDEGEDAS